MHTKFAWRKTEHPLYLKSKFMMSASILFFIFIHKPPAVTASLAIYKTEGDEVRPVGTSNRA